MNNQLLLMYLCLISHFAWGKTPESEVQKLKPNVDEDYIVIYQDDWGADRLKMTLLLYDNAEMKGAPAFTITPQEISDNKNHYKFSDSFQGSCKPVCKYKFIPIDFVRIYYRNLALAVKDYKNEIARVEHNKKSYFFKFNMSWASEYSWRYYSKKSAINNLLKEDPSYAVFVEEIKKCILKKDLKCLEPLLDDSYLDIKKIEVDAKKRGIFDDVELCEKFEDFREKHHVGADDVPEELLREIKNIDFMWSKLSENLVLGKEGDKLEIMDFGNRKLFNSSKELKVESCGEWLDLSIEFLKKDQKWVITHMGLYAFIY